MKTYMDMTCRILSAAVLLLMVFVVSCTRVEYLDSVDNVDGIETLDELTTIGFDIVPPSGLSADDVPPYAMVLMNRILNTTVHYAFKFEDGVNVDQFGLPAGSVPETGGSEPEAAAARSGETGDSESEEDADGDDGSDTEDGVEEDVPEEDDGSLKVHVGQYSVAAVAATDYNDFIVSDLETYGESLDFRMRDVYVTIPQLSKEDRLSKDYIDFNPMYPYIRCVEPFWYVRPSNDTHAHVSTGNDNVIRLELMPLTKEISFSINMDIEEGVEVKRCVGTISGVPQRIQLMTGAVSDEDTGKVPFEMTNKSGNTYEGHINAFGLFGADDSDMIVGPGVLTVIIHASVENEGVICSRIFYASLPLSDKIRKAEIMRQEDHVDGYIFTDAKSYHISVDKTLEVTREMVLSGVAEGYEEWQRNEEDNDDEDKNPGLNMPV